MALATANAWSIYQTSTPRTAASLPYSFPLRRSMSHPNFVSPSGVVAAKPLAVVKYPSTLSAYSNLRVASEADLIGARRREAMSAKRAMDRLEHSVQSHLIVSRSHPTTPTPSVSSSAPRTPQATASFVPTQTEGDVVAIERPRRNSFPHSSLPLIETTKENSLPTVTPPSDASVPVSPVSAIREDSQLTTDSHHSDLSTLLVQPTELNNSEQSRTFNEAQEAQFQSQQHSSTKSTIGNTPPVVKITDGERVVEGGRRKRAASATSVQQMAAQGEYDPLILSVDVFFSVIVKLTSCYCHNLLSVASAVGTEALRGPYAFVKPVVTPSMLLSHIISSVSTLSVIPSTITGSPSTGPLSPTQFVELTQTPQLTRALTVLDHTPALNTHKV
jgi:hypothetical protein